MNNKSETKLSSVDIKIATLNLCLGLKFKKLSQAAVWIELCLKCTVYKEEVTNGSSMARNTTTIIKPS